MLEFKGKRNKNVFPALFFAIIVMMICCLGCGDSVHDEICRASCETIGAEFKGTHTDWPTPTRQEHFCDCRFKLPTFRKPDTSSPKQDTQQKQDKPSIGGTMVQR